MRNAYHQGGGNYCVRDKQKFGRLPEGKRMGGFGRGTRKKVSQVAEDVEPGKENHGKPF